MTEYAVFYHGTPGDYLVSHIYVQAESKDDALEVAKKQLKKDARLVSAHESPEWKV